MLHPGTDAERRDRAAGADPGRYPPGSDVGPAVAAAMVLLLILLPLITG